VLYVCMCIAMRKEDNDMCQAMFPAKKKREGILKRQLANVNKKKKNSHLCNRLQDHSGDRQTSQKKKMDKY